MYEKLFKPQIAHMFDWRNVLYLRGVYGLMITMCINEKWTGEQKKVNRKICVIKKKKREEKGREERVVQKSRWLPLPEH